MLLSNLIAWILLGCAAVCAAPHASPLAILEETILKDFDDELAEPANFHTASSLVSHTVATALKSTTKSTTSSATETCKVCIGCANDGFQGDPPDYDGGEWAPKYSQKDSEKLQGDKLDPLRGLLTSHDASSNSELRKRDRREFDLCKQTAESPSYTPWSKTTKKTWPYFDHRISDICPKYQFDLLHQKNNDRSYAAEHIYEVQLVVQLDKVVEDHVVFTDQLQVKQFFQWRMDQPDFQTFAGSDPCVLIRAVLFPKSQWWNTKWGYGTSKGSRPFDTIINQLSGDNTPNEMVFLQASLNRLKGNLMAKDSLGGSSSYAVNLRRAAGIKLVLQYMGENKDIFKAVSARVRGALKTIDDAMEDSPHGAIKDLRNRFPTLHWASDYDVWLNSYLTEIDNNADKYIRAILQKAGDQIDAEDNPDFRKDPKKGRGDLRALRADIGKRKIDSFKRPQDGWLAGLRP